MTWWIKGYHFQENAWLVEQLKSCGVKLCSPEWISWDFLGAAPLLEVCQRPFITGVTEVLGGKVRATLARTPLCVPAEIMKSWPGSEALK